ncbi:MAG: enoyl-CoA hydratase/isomerase family protein [Actinobacteria bacterium]|nr:enoyl-CoA hydratase/isomerase family protein [Actinomycetota bacterium]
MPAVVSELKGRSSRGNSKKNALTQSMFQGLRDLFLEVGDRADDRVLIITGGGDAFSSGADLTDPDAAMKIAGGRGSALAWMRLVEQAALMLHELPKPTIAAVNGVAAGASLNMALGCDLILASEEARFSEIFVHRGLVLDFGGHWLLPRLVGLHRAKELAFFGEILSAAEADDLGLVNRVVPPADLLPLAREWAARLAALPPINLSIMKRALNRALETSMAASLEFEAVAQNVSFSSVDTVEAMAAFAEKREPQFRGE